MESVKKWLLERKSKRNGIYVHYSPPKAVGVVSGAQLRQWARGGTESRLERAVINGQGRRLLAEAEALHLSPHLPALVAKCEALHAAVERGSLVELQLSMELLDSEYHRKKFVMCRDVAGTGLLHKAIYYDFMDIAEWLIKTYPMLVHQRDVEGRTPLHYACMCRDEAGAAALLEGAGAARGARDAAGHTPAHYRGQAGTTLALPVHNMSKEAAKQPPGFVIKRHNIRIWFHDCDMARLQRVVWEGHGAKLLSEVSNQHVVKRFLEALPYIMNTIRDIHVSVIQNDLEAVMKHSGDPVPPQILSSRDGNYMTVMHKAAGLGHGGILKYVASRYPEGVNDVDNDGRTPLHYAAAVRDDQHTYHTLVSLGADEGATDNKNKTPGYYVNRPQDIDKNIFKSLPEAPRTPSSAYPSSWDWKLLDTEVIAELNKKSRRKNFKASSENISSKNNTVSENFKSERSMKNSNTHDLIKDLPELDDNGATENGISFEDIDKKESELADNEHETEEVNLTDNHNEEDQEAVLKVNGTENNDETKNEEDNPTEDETVEVAEQNEELKKHEHNSEVEVDNNGTDINDCETTQQNDEKQNENKDQVDNKDIEESNEQENEEKQADQDTDEIHHNAITENDKNEDDESLIKLEKDNDNEKEENDSQNEHEESSPNEILPPKQEERDNPEEEGRKYSAKEKIENEEEKSATLEGNENKQFVEDDDDVQVQGDTPSEYSDINLRSTAEASDTEITKRGNLITGRNTQESLIEGIVNGEIEQDSKDASIGQTDESIKGEMLVVDSQIDPEVTDLINSANMEMLAALVLNGEGSRLIGRNSRNPELQAFLDNVPSYMQKIKKVHIAAKEGNIRDLQAALDRRKFAIARDLISPNGATPLHVATIYGKTNIMKYLGGRFPETLSAVDFEGRTALHYSAVLPDNGHYYNLLQQLGANSKDLDDSGRSAENFLKNPSLLPYDQLLADFNISEEVAKNILSDKIPEDSVSSRRSLEAPEVLDTLERCYRLLASARPARTPLSASSNKATPPLVLGRFLKRPIFEIVKHRVTKLDHDLFDVIWPAVKKLPENRNILQTVEEDFPGGVAAPDYYVYEVFQEFLTPLIKDLHNINVNSDLQLHPPSDFVRKKTLTPPSSSSSELIVELNIDPRDEFVLSSTLECSRNLNNFELPLNLKIGQLEMIERVVTSLLLHDEFKKLSEQSNPESDQKGGNYYTLNEVLEKPSEICASLASAGLLIALCDKEEIDDYSRLHGKHWPYGRGVFVSDDNSVAIWVNVHDHIRVLVCTPTETPGEIGQAFSKMSHIMTYLHEKLDFAWDFKFGHLSSRPTFLGSGIRFSMIINFPGLSKDSDNMKQLCAMRGLQYRETLSPGIARISNYQCLGISEANCFEDFTAATSNLLQLEKESSMQNSTHIATMLTNIFRRKKNSLANMEDSDTNENR